MIQNIMHVSKSGMSSTRDKISLVSSNMINSTTTGYKKLESEFQTLVSSSLDKDSYPNYSENVSTGTGVKTSEPFRRDEQGMIKETGKFCDFAIIGEGYFRVIKPDGTYAYTRNGAFNIDGMGRIVDDYGNFLDITFANGYSYDNLDFSHTSDSRVNSIGTASDDGIDRDGVIRINGITVGKINIYNSVGDDDLRSIRDNLFVPKDGVNMVQSKSSYMRQGYIELSNVNLGEEMINLIALQRAYQLNSKGVITADEMWSLINGM